MRNVTEVVRAARTSFCQIIPHTLQSSELSVRSVLSWQLDGNGRQLYVDSSFCHVQRGVNEYHSDRANVCSCLWFTAQHISHLETVSIQPQVKVSLALFQLLLQVVQVPGTVYSGSYSLVTLAIRVLLPVVVAVDVKIWSLKFK